MKNKEEVLSKLFDKKTQFIENNLQNISNKASKIQRDLLEMIYNDYISKFEYKDGVLINSTKNYRLVNNFDSLLDDFQQTYINPYVQGIGENMIGLVAMNDKYFKALGGSDKIARVAEKLQWLNQKIGIKDGSIIEGSYLDNLAKAPELRNELKDYVLKNVVNNNGQHDFQKGFKELLSNSEDVDGSMVKYYKQYTYDTFNQVDETINNVYAEELDLKYFVYAGTIMGRTRCFCKKRNNKVFNIEDTNNWKNDPTLPVTPNYNPLIDRGSYNCRHNIRYITEDRAIELGYNKEEAKSVVYKTCKDD